MRKLACFGALLFAAWAADRPDINGKWVLDAAHSESGKLKSETLSINQKDDAVQISDEMTESSGKAVKVDISCNTEGQECKVNESGQPAKVSFWYNGPMLGHDGAAARQRFRHQEKIQAVRGRQDPQHGSGLHCAARTKAENYTFTKQ